jgi:hypothetical protein
MPQLTASWVELHTTTAASIDYGNARPIAMASKPPEHARLPFLIEIAQQAFLAGSLCGLDVQFKV